MHINVGKKVRFGQTQEWGALIWAHISWCKTENITHTHTHTHIHIHTE